jgi:thiamine biosynthesis lipoprotein
MKNKRNIVWLLLLAVASCIIIVRHNKDSVYQSDHGFVFGTIYNITYRSSENLKSEIEDELKRFDFSLSPFNDSSVISRVNRNEDIVVDTLFRNCFNKAIEVSDITDGAFDITIAPLANAWGFGFKHGDFPDSLTIDSLLQITGFDKVALNGDKVVKSDDRMQLSCSAIAKGYAVDVIASFLEKKGIKDFMVDIGGEIVAKGDNPKGTLWHIGVNKPIDDSLSVNQEIQAVLKLTNVGMATSGNYRNYYYKDGKKYAHTIDPRTGYPVQHSLLSATVIAEDCMTADALATSFMVMGLEEAERFVDAHPAVEAYFIYSDSTGTNKTYFTKGMEKYLDSSNKQK